MTTKEKYELIDKTKINEKVLAILQNMEKSSRNFTDEAVNSKIDGALDKLIEGFRANKPEALRTLPEAKKEVKKEKEKATKENEGKDLSDKKDTDDKTGLPKKDTLEERKDIIKKQSESEKEARDRARKELEKEKDKAKDEVESQIEKLNRLILEDPSLRGFNTGTAATGGGRSTPIIDAERKALPRGSRVSQKGWKNQYGASDGGRKYWENRENRSDRKSPEYETGKPYLAKGGNVYSSDELYIVKVYDGKTNELLDMSKRVWARNLQKAKEEAIDNYEYDMKQQYGDDLRFQVEEAPSMFADGGFMADGGVINTRQLNKKIKDWYIKTYPTDEEGKEIDDKITFKAFYGYLWQGYDVYDVLEVNDSLIRERVFEKLSEILGVDYDVVYKKWLQSGEYDKGGMMADGGQTDGELYIAYENTFKRFDSDVPVPMEDFEKLLHAYQKQLSGDKLDVVKYEVLKGQMGNYLGHKTVEEMEAYFIQRRNSYKMAHGGGVPYKPYGKTKGRFKLTYEVEGEPQSEIRESLEEAMNSAKRYSSPKLGYTDVHIYDESGKEYFFADGGRVDFNEKMAKMRSAYNNLEMLVKGKIASAVGIDEAIRIMENDYEIHPFDFITRAVRSGLLGLDEINRDLVCSALMEAENITEEYRDSGQGIGSSDMTYFTKDVLDCAGVKTGFVNNRLTRVDADGNELVIDKYEMNY